MNRMTERCRIGPVSVIDKENCRCTKISRNGEYTNEMVNKKI